MNFIPLLKELKRLEPEKPMVTLVAGYGYSSCGFSNCRSLSHRATVAIALRPGI